MRLLCIAILASLFVADPANAASVGIAIKAFATAVSAAAGSGWVVGTITKLAGSLLLSSLAQKIRGKPSEPDPPGISTKTTTTGGTQPVSFILGRYATAGNHVCPPYTRKTVDKVPNAYLTYVVDIADMPGHTLSRVIVDDSYVTLGDTANGWGYPINQYSSTKTKTTWEQVGEGEDKSLKAKSTTTTKSYARVKYYDGTQTAADPAMLNAYGSHGARPWTSDMIGTGVCYAILTFRFKREYFNSLPRVRFEVIGLPLYDPRKDDTVGGTGPHRWGDRSTWEQSENKALMIYNVLRGIHLPDGSIWGGNVGAADLPVDNWFAAMNECDLLIETESGSFEPQYIGGIEVQVDTQPADVINDLLAGCDAQISEMGGVYKIRVGAPGLPVYYVTDDDIIITEKRELDPFPSLDQTFNAVHASYVEPANRWEPKDAPPRYNSAYESEDQGQRLVAELNLNTVFSAGQVQRIMRANIEGERRHLRHRMVLPPDAAVLEPLDTIAWTSARNNYAGKNFEVGELVDDLRTANQSIGLRERDPGDNQWTDGFFLPWDVPSPADVIDVLTSLPGLDVFPTKVKDGDGNDRRPAIAVFWGDDLDELSQVMWQVRDAVSKAAIATGSTTDIESQGLMLTDGIVSGIDYEVRFKAASSSGLDTEWSDWQLVTAPDVPLTYADLEDSVSQDIERAQYGAFAAREIAKNAFSAAVGAGANQEAFFGLEPMDAGGGRIGIQSTRLSNAVRGARDVVVLWGDQVIAPGTMSTNRLVVGLGTNEVPNSQFRKGITNYKIQGIGGVFADAEFRLRQAGENWSGATYPVMEIKQTGFATDGYADLVFQMIREDGTSDNRMAPAQAGKWYDFRAIVGTHRCAGHLYVAWKDEDGNTLSYSGTPIADSDHGESEDPATWPEYWFKAQAPAGTSFRQMFIRKTGTTDTSGSSSYLFFLEPSSALTHADATAPVPYAPDGTTLIYGDEITTGAIRAEHLSAEAVLAENISGDRMSARYLSVDELLEISALNSGFSIGKTSVGDPADGLYMGTVDEGGVSSFGFSVGRTNLDRQQHILITQQSGLEIKNARFVLSAAIPVPQIEVTTDGFFDLPAGTLKIDLTQFGAGGGGATGNTSSSYPGRYGDDGGDTTIELYDGDISTGVVWMASGGDGGVRKSGGNDSGNAGKSSSIGSGGAGGKDPEEGYYTAGGEDEPDIFNPWRRPDTNGKNASGYAAGGGGGGGTDRGGTGGNAGQHMSVIGYDVSGLTAPRLFVTIGQGGDGGSTSDNDQGLGGRGSDGLVRYTAYTASDIAADVVPMAPTSTGTMSSHGPFPDLGPGHWTIYTNNPSTENVTFGDLDIGLAGEVFRAVYGSSTSFFAPKTPVVMTTPYSAKTLQYMFRKMGDWS